MRPYAVYEDWLEIIQPEKIRISGEIPILINRLTNVLGIKIFWVTNKSIKYSQSFLVDESFWNILVNKNLLYSFKRVFTSVIGMPKAWRKLL